MITTNINGNTISQAFIDEIRSDSPNVIAKLLLNGTEIDCDIARITIQKGSCGSQNFALGDVVGTKLLATVKNLSDTLKGEVIECQIGAWTGVSYEYISVCKAKVSECKSTRYQTDITAYSSVVSDTTEKFDVTNLSSNPTISDIADEVETQINHTITFDPSIDTSKVVMQTLNGLNIYQVLQVIAICSGGYVCNSHDNEICVKQFGGTATIIVSSGAILTTSSGDHIIALGTNAQEELPVDTGMMVKLPEREEELYSITGIYCLVQEASVDNDGNDIPAIEYQSGTVNYAIESKYVTSDIFNANLKTIIGYGYYPANVNLTLGDPRLEGDDVLNVTDVDGTQYLVPCHIITHTYSGGISSVIKSAEASALENDVGTMPPITAQLSVMKQDTVKAQTTADEAQTIARNNAQYFWFLESDPNNTGVGTGAHITETPKEDFMDDPTNGGGNLLARSNGIAVRDGLVELATFGATGATVGALANKHLDISSGGFVFKSGNSELARLQSYSTGVSLGSGDIAYRTDDSSVIDFGSNSVAVFAKDGNESYSTSFHVAPNEVNAYVGQYEYGQLMLVDNALIFRTTNSMANNALFIGGENFTKFTVDWNGNAVGNSFSGKIDAVVYEDFDFSVTYSAGTVGTRGAEYTASGAKSGYKPISATVIAGNTYYNFFVARVADEGTVTLSAYRATTSARSDDAVKVRVAYLKV